MTIIPFILLMILGEMVISCTDTNDSNNKAIELKVQIQFLAMVFLLIVVYFSYYRILKSKRKPVETMDSMLK